MDLQLANKLALISGSTAGIGFAIARALAAEGARVIVNGRTPDGPFGEKLMTPKDGTRWHDRVAARSLLSFSWRRPVRRAASVRIPFLLVVPEADAIAPVPAALEVARRASGAELFRSAGGHYDVYEGGASFADVLRTEIDFLHRHAKVATRKV